MIGFFIQFGELLVQLPVNPNSLKITGSSSNKTTTMVGSNELNNIGFEKLKDVTITSFFPANEGAYYINTNNNFEKPDFYIDLFETIKKERKYVRLIISSLNINMLVSVEAFDITYKYGSDDVDYSLKLKEYREHNIKTLIPSGDNFITVNSVDSNSINGKVIPSSYIVKEGDTLWSIARSLLGSGSKWYDIYTYNNNSEVIGNNPNLLKEGQTLSIPN